MTDITEKVEIIRSRRKTLSLQISPDGRVVARAPLRMPEKDIRDFIRRRSDWIEKHLSRIADSAKVPAMTEEELRELADRALRYIPERVRYYAPIVGHELCHRKEMNHSPRFYAEVLRVYPDYYKWNDWLKKNGAALLARLPR